MHHTKIKGPHGGARTPGTLRRAPTGRRINVAMGVEPAYGLLWLSVLRQAVIDARSNFKAERDRAAFWFHSGADRCLPGSFAWLCDNVLRANPARVLEHLGLTKEQLYPQGRAA